MGISQFDLQQMQARTEGARRNSRLGSGGHLQQKSAEAVEREADLHEQIRQDCLRRGWLPLHGSTAHRVFRTLGEWDFIVLAEHPRVLLVECKDREGKVSKAQAELHAWAKKLGHPTCIVRSFQDWLDFAAQG